MNKKSLFSFIVVSAILLLTGCNPPVQPTISIVPTSITLNLDETYALQATITPDNGNTPITWESSNMDVATVDAEGVVTAIAAGTTTIIATIADTEPAECVVTVVDNAIVMLTDTLELFVDDTYQLVAKLPACDTTAQIIWTSLSPEVADVAENGLVTAKAEGTAIITASAEGLKTAQCLIKVNNIPSSFPRKHLIEHFTGDGCGYCPGGMFALKEYTTKTNTSCIWVSHHYGYNQDEYTISGSAKIGSACGVQGAPSMAYNRTKMMGTSIAFHPGYLPEDGMAETMAEKCTNEAEASVVIKHTVNGDQLNVNVSGLVANTEVTEYLLTVLVKENGLVGKQADYTYSWKTSGYKEFLHPRVARYLLTAPLGDTVLVKNQRYSKNLTCTIPVNWVPENCCVVAYITPLSKKPVINAEQVVLVEGTTGGEEYLPYGITENKEPTNATSLTFTEGTVSKPSSDKLTLTLIASKSTRSDAYGPLKMVINVDINTTDSILTEGVYDITEGSVMGTVSAGTTDMKNASFGGTYLSYVTSTSIEEGEWQYCHFWRANSGTMTVGADSSVVLEGKLFNGKNFKATYTPAQ